MRRGVYSTPPYLLKHIVCPHKHGTCRFGRLCLLPRRNNADPQISLDRLGQTNPALDSGATLCRTELDVEFVLSSDGIAAHFKCTNVSYRIDE